MQSTPQPYAARACAGVSERSQSGGEPEGEKGDTTTYVRTTKKHRGRAHGLYYVVPSCHCLPPCIAKPRAESLRAAQMGVSSFEAAVVAHAAATATAFVHSAFSGPGDASLALVLSRLLLPATQSTAGLVFLANCGLSALLLASVVARAVFLGPLSAVEAANASERALSWLMLKTVTVASLLSEPDAAEVLVWCVWLACLGALKVFACLAKDRFERQSSSPSVTRLEHARTLALIVGLLVADAWAAVLASSVFTGVTRCLLLYDTLTIGTSLLLLAVRFAAHLYEAALFASASSAEAIPSGERRRSLLFVADFVAEALTDVLSLAHSALIYWLHGLSLQLVDAIMLLYMRALALSLWQRVSRFVSFMAVSRDLQRAYADVSPEELAARDEDCAVCREHLDRAKRLPCGHMFHHLCLQRWLQVKVQCPTCRHALR